MVIEPITDEHKCKQFDCGEPEMNDWLNKRAYKNNYNGVCSTYVAVEPEGDKIVRGYYALGINTISPVLFPGLVSNKMTIPVILLARLAVDKQYASSGYGRQLIFHSLRKSQDIADHVGVVAVVLDALNENLIGYYERFGFQKLGDEPLRMFITLRIYVKTLASCVRS